MKTVKKLSQSLLIRRVKKINSIACQAKKLLQGKLPRISILLPDSDRAPKTTSDYTGHYWVKLPVNYAAQIDLKAVVYRAILSKVYNIPDAANCPLMSGYSMPCNSNQADKLFLQYASKAI